MSSQLTINPNLTCRSGLIVPAEQIGFIQRGTHRLLDARGQVIASLRSNTINLSALEGRFVTVCGINEGIIEGVLSLNVTVVPSTVPTGGTLPAIDTRLLLLLFLLNQAGLGRGINQSQLLQILLSSGLLQGGSLGI